MASVIKVETFDKDVGTSGSTHTLTNDVGATSAAFIRYNHATDKCSGGPTGSTGNTNPNVAHCGAQLTGTSTITFYKNTSTTVKIIGEVWRYTGSGGGNDEFITRGHYAVSISGTSASQSVSGISNRNKCVPFITGVDTSEASRSNYEMCTFAAHIDSSNNLVVSRNNSGTTATVYVSVVEFTGSNWRVGHGVSSSHDSSSETVTLNTDSTGTGGSTFDVYNFENAIIEGSMGGDSSETGLSDCMTLIRPHPNDTTKIIFDPQEADGSARNDATGYVHVIWNAGLIVKRAHDNNVSEGNGSYGNVSWPTGASTSESIDELGLEWFVDTSGTGTAHARGRLGARITSASGTIQHWVHRSGNTVQARYGVINLSNIDGTAYPYISDMEDEQIDIGETDNVIDGGNFESTQGTGKVELCNNADYSAATIKVNQTIDSWSDTQIQFDSVQGSLQEGQVYIFVTNNSGDTNVTGYAVNLGELDYETVIYNLNPDHLWTFDNTYADTGVQASHPADSNQSGTPSFVSDTLARGTSYALECGGGTDQTGPENSNYINIGTAKTRRTMGGWIKVDSIQTDMACIYEEGAQIRNYCFIMGLGNQLLTQAVTEDSPTFNIQVYSNRPVPVDRPIHICFRFSGNGYNNKFDLFVDGVKMDRGYPADQQPDMAALGNHSGDIKFGGSGTTLEVGGTDITFGMTNSCKYSCWATWSESNTLTDTEIKEDLFEAGAVQMYSISSSATSAMQSKLESYDDSTHVDWPLTFKIYEPTDTDSPTFTLTNQMFDENISCHIRWMGTGMLTIRNSGTSNVDKSLISISSTSSGASATIIETAPITITVKDIDTKSVIQGAMVLLKADSGGPLSEGTEIIKTTTDVNGQVTGEIDFTANQPVIGVVRKGSSSIYYISGNISGTITSTGLDLTVLLVPDE